MKSEFKLVLGPMASGKSRTLITELEKFEYANKRIVTVQPEINVRNEVIESRNGMKRDAIKLRRLGDLALRESLENVDVIGIDEAFMFEAKDLKESILTFLQMGKTVVAASLDVMGNGHMPESVVAMKELVPDTQYETAVCAGCDSLDGRMTQTYDKKTGEPLTELPDVVPDDGSIGYRPVCRECYYGIEQ